ncbi:MAG: inositol monophosphatase [Acidimicrobiia bacterium]|nr:inositol monophosphatase [Acidimicrobiia bacterium]
MLHDLDDLLALASEVAEEAAGLLLAGLDQARVAVATKSSLTDVVTEYDHRAEALIAGRLAAARPGDGLLAEEGSSRPSASGVRWVVDPLDGTVNYLYGHPGFAVSIAAEVDGELAVGVVHDPLSGDTFAAARGRGSTRNGAPIAVRPPPGLAAALVATGFSYRPEHRQRQARALVHVLPRVRDVRRMGSAAIDLCSVASGRVDAYYEELLNPWDFAAGTVIAREAGAIVTDGEGGPPSSRLCVAAAPPLHDALVDLLIAAGRA